MSISAFSTRQHGCPLIFTHWFEQRCSLTAMASSSCRRLGEQCQVGLAFTAQYGEIDLDGSQPARLGERHRLRLDRLRGEDAPALGLCGVLADEPEVARELLDGVDRADALDLDRDPLP